MTSLSFVLFTFFSLSLSSTIQDIEKAFLENNPKMLYALFPAKSQVHISLPEPISFSDQLSGQQAFFLLKRIFSSYSTFEFFTERQPQVADRKSTIIKASWSLRDNRNKNQYVFHIFFHLLHQQGHKTSLPESPWKIIEIKAVKI